MCYVARIIGFIEVRGKDRARLYTDRHRIAAGGRYITSSSGYTFETTDLNAVWSLFHPRVMFSGVDVCVRVEYMPGKNPKNLSLAALRELAVRVLGTTPAGEQRAKRRKNQQVFKVRKDLLSMIERQVAQNALAVDPKPTFGLVHRVRCVHASVANDVSRAKKFKISLQQRCGGTQFTVRVWFHTVGIAGVEQGNGETIWRPLHGDQ